MAVGKSILMDCNLIMLKLTITKEASKKNIMSINGIISIRDFLCAMGEPIFMLPVLEEGGSFRS
jgi:hypothetical protein